MDVQKLVVRMPGTLHKQVVKKAKERFRSMNGQICSEINHAMCCFEMSAMFKRSTKNQKNFVARIPGKLYKKLKKLAKKHDLSINETILRIVS